MLIYQLFLLLIVSLFPECISQGCDCPRTPRNGFTSGCVRSGLSVSYHCDPGYSLEGNSTRTCMSNGSWTGIAPMCQENLCSCPQFPANGYTSECAEEGPTVSYHCYTGYSLVGTSTRTCNSSGVWSGSAPVCRKEFCSCPPQIEYGFYSRCSGIIGDEISYTCRPGYSFIGNSSIHRRCSGGVWSGRSPTCRKITCGLLSQPTFGATVQYHTSNGSILALYECTSGYHLVGSSTRTCTSDDTWTGRAPTCIRNLCRCPPSPANGYTRECVDSGTVVSYHCISGYRLVGNNRRTCLSTSNDWSGSAPSCQKILCSCPIRLRGGRIEECTGIEGSSIAYKCATGFQLIGNGTRTCTSSGEWTGIAPRCDSLRIECKCPTSPSNGYITQCSNSGVRYKCYSGYRLIGNASRTCLSTNIWSGRDPTCEKITCTCPLRPRNGYISRCMETLGSTVSYSCQSGYHLVGNSTRKCTFNGFWTGSAPTCEQDTCTCPPALTNGRSTSGCSGVGTVVYHYCNGYGYELLGSKQRQCYYGGAWSGSDTICQKPKCPCPPSPNNGYTSNCTSPQAIGGRVRFYCNSGYRLVGYGYTSCTTRGVWSQDVPRCEKISCVCPSHSPNGYSVSCTGIAGSSIRLTCYSAYTLVGDSVRICSSNGSWSGVAPSCLPSRTVCTCPSSPPHGYTSGCSVRNAKVSYHCNSGYHLVGSSSRSCYNNYWSGRSPVCLLPCSCPPSPLNGYTSGCTGNGTGVNYSCHSGYALVGSSSRSCTSGGTWSGSAPTCQRSCPCPSQPRNGYTRKCSGSGTEVYHYCNRGYQRVGNLNRTCSPTGLWSGSAPTCREITCLCPPSPLNGYTSGCTGNGTGVNYRCSSGYALVGSSSRSCTSRGTWSGSAPTCQRLCPCPSQPRNGYNSGCSGSGTKVLYHYCNRGYQRVGNLNRTCLPTGVWSGSAPTCHKIPCSCPPSPLNGYTFGCTGSGTSVNYRCNSEYTLVGSSSRSCTSRGTWSGSAPTCQRICDCPSYFTNGYTVCSRAKGTLRYYCNNGYEVIGSNFRTCTSYGTWTGSNPICQKISHVDPTDDVSSNVQNGNDGIGTGGFVGVGVGVGIPIFFILMVLFVLILTACHVCNRRRELQPSTTERQTGQQNRWVGIGVHDTATSMAQNSDMNEVSSNTDPALQNLPSYQAATEDLDKYKHVEPQESSWSRPPSYRLHENPLHNTPDPEILENTSV